MPDNHSGTTTFIFQEINGQQNLQIDPVDRSTAFFPDGRGRSLHRFASLESAAAILLFLLLAGSLFSSSSLLPFDVVFLLAASSAHSAAAYQPFDLQYVRIDRLPHLRRLCRGLAHPCRPPAPLVAELALAATLALQGLWSLQTGLSLYIESFVPEGYHRLLDLPDGDATATRCDLEESRIRAAALLDLTLVLHAACVSVVSVVVYAAVARAYGVPVSTGPHRRGSYEALPTSSSTGALSDIDQVQMKAITKTSSMQV